MRISRHNGSIAILAASALTALGCVTNDTTSSTGSASGSGGDTTSTTTTTSSSTGQGGSGDGGSAQGGSSGDGGSAQGGSSGDGGSAQGGSSGDGGSAQGGSSGDGGSGGQGGGEVACLAVELTDIVPDAGSYYGVIQPGFGGADPDLGSIYFDYQAGTFDLSEEQQYATAQHGFLAGEDVAADGSVAGAYFFQSQGTLIVDAGTFTATGVRLVEVTLDPDGTSTPVPNGRCLDFADVTGALHPPLSWLCDPSYYDGADGCDCGCGAYDPDCDLPEQTVYGCGDAEICVQPGVCEAAPEVVCDDFVDDDADGLIDCADPTLCQGTPACIPGATATGMPCTMNTECAASNGAPACLTESLFDFDQGACSRWCSVAAQDCDPDEECVDVGAGDAGLCVPTCVSNEDCAHPNATCINDRCTPNGSVPAAWACDPSFYDTEDGCDCGCGAVDPDCDDATSASCNYCDDDGSCSALACPGTIDPSNNAACTN